MSKPFSNKYRILLQAALTVVFLHAWLVGGTDPLWIGVGVAILIGVVVAIYIESKGKDGIKNKILRMILLRRE